MTFSPSGHQPLLPAYLEKWATDTPGRIAMVESATGTQWLYGQLAGRMYMWVEFLRAKKVEPGDRVMVAIEPGPNAMALVWACWRLGAVPCLLPLNLPVHRLIRAWGMIEPTWSFISPDILDQLILAGVKFRREATHAFLVDTRLSRKGVKRVPAKLASNQPTQLQRMDFRKRRARINRLPKVHAWHPALILASHERLHTPFLMCFEHLEAQLSFLASRCSHDDQIKTLVQAADTQWQEWLMGWILPLAKGGTVVMGPRIARRQQLHSLIETYQVNTMVNRELDPAYIHSRRGPRRRSLDSVRQVFVPSQRVHAHDREILHHSLTLGLCLPETGGYFVMQIPSTQDKTPSFVPLSLMSIRKPMLPDGRDGEPLGENTWGEVCIHPPMVFAGFLDPNLSINPQVSREGLYYTGLRGCLKTVAESPVLYLEATPAEKPHRNPLGRDAASA